MLAAFLTLYQFFLRAEGAPTGTTWQPLLNNMTALQEVHAPAWVPKASYRGTWDVLYSCTITLGLCVYTAIHLNIPSLEESRFSFYLRKTKWVVIAVFAPEVVLYTAWTQWDRARDISSRLNRLVRLPQLSESIIQDNNFLVQVDKKREADKELQAAKKEHEQPRRSTSPGPSEGQKQASSGIIESETTEMPSPSEDTPASQENDSHTSSKESGTHTAAALKEYPKYDLVAGYYIVMGGFVARCDLVNSRIEHFQPNFSGENYGTLNPDTVEALAKNGHFLPVQTRTVQDKSKADILAKGLVCFQVLWMLLEASDTELNPVNYLDLTALAERGSKTVRISLGATGSPHICPRAMCAHHVRTVVQKTHGYSRPDST
jgi:hypothetical protein